MEYTELPRIKKERKIKIMFKKNRMSSRQRCQILLKRKKKKYKNPTAKRMGDEISFSDSETATAYINMCLFYQGDKKLKLIFVIQRKKISIHTHTLPKNEKLKSPPFLGFLSN